MPVELGNYDFRHQVTNYCNLRCRYCLNEGLPIGESRGGLVKEVKDLTIDQTIQLYGAIFRALPKKIRCFALTGGEPTLFGDNLIPLMQTLEQNEIQWFLNSNASQITPDFADKLLRAGLREIKVNFPSMNPQTHLVLTERELLQNQIEGVNACIDRGMKVDINIPLIKGMNDKLDDLAVYVGFFKRAVRPDQVQIKYFRLEAGNYGDSRDKQFFDEYAVSTENLRQEIKGKFIGEEDFGRKEIYSVGIDGVAMKVAIIDNCSPEQIKDHPTNRTSFVITHDGKMRRMWDKTSYQFRFDTDSESLDKQVQEALEFFK